MVALALRLWPDVRTRGAVDDPSDLDRLLATLGRPGAPGYPDGIRYTFGCFPPEEVASVLLPGGERAATDEAARFIGHVLVTRVLLGSGLAIDERVAGAMAMTSALSWTRRTGEHYGRTPLEMAVALWPVVLDPDADSDRPVSIDWGAACFRDARLWDPDYRLFSHYDIRERALDWALWAAHDPARLAGVSVWTVIEPLLRLVEDDRAALAASRLAELAPHDPAAPAAALLERNRVATLYRAWEQARR